MRGLSPRLAAGQSRAPISIMVAAPGAHPALACELREPTGYSIPGSNSETHIRAMPRWAERASRCCACMSMSEARIEACMMVCTTGSIGPPSSVQARSCTFIYLVTLIQRAASHRCGHYLRSCGLRNISKQPFSVVYTLRLISRLCLAMRALESSVLPFIDNNQAIFAFDHHFRGGNLLATGIG